MAIMFCGFKPLEKVSTSLGLLPQSKCHPFLPRLQIFEDDILIVIIIMMVMIMIMTMLKRILDEDVDDNIIRILKYYLRYYCGVVFMAFGCLQNPSSYKKQYLLRREDIYAHLQPL